MRELVLVFLAEDLRPLLGTGLPGTGRLKISLLRAYDEPGENRPEGGSFDVFQPDMRRRSRRGAVIIARTRTVPIHRQPLGRLTLRRRFRPVRVGVLLGLIAVIRLAQAVRPRWRVAGAVAGFLIEVVGFNIFSGGMQVASSLVGMALLLFALMKDAKQCSSRQASIPAAMRPPC